VVELKLVSGIMKRQKTRQSNQQAGQRALLSPKADNGGNGVAADRIEKLLARLRRPDPVCDESMLHADRALQSVAGN